MQVQTQEHPPASGESELLRRMRGGDSHAFAALMRQNNRRLYRLARGILHDEHEAEDAVQEGYLRAFAHLASFKGEATLATWLARIVVNEALGRLRRRRPVSDINSLADSLASDAPADGTGALPASPEQLAARQEIRRAIEHAVDTLPRRSGRCLCCAQSSSSARKRPPICSAFRKRPLRPGFTAPI